MALTFNLRHLEKKPLHLEGELPVEELDLQIGDELVRVTGPLEYDLEVEEIEQAALVQGELHLSVECECARCLKKFSCHIDLDDWTSHLPLTGEDAVPVSNDLVDLTPHIREDILLALPQHPLCGPECGGLKSPAAEDPGRKSVETTSAWDELDKLKLKR